MLAGMSLLLNHNYNADTVCKFILVVRQQKSLPTDAFMLHDCEIYLSCDDSAIWVFENHQLSVRRPRKYGPFRVKLLLKITSLLMLS